LQDKGMSNKSFDIKRTMSIDDYAYVKGIHKDLVIELIKKKKINSVKLNGERYVYLTLATIEWNDKE
jgi:hypothetical protein